MGTWILWFHIVFDGNSMIIQDRFATEEACKQGASQIRYDLGSDYGVRVRSFTCINSEGVR